MMRTHQALGSSPTRASLLQRQVPSAQSRTLQYELEFLPQPPFYCCPSQRTQPVLAGVLQQPVGGNSLCPILSLNCDGAKEQNFLTQTSTTLRDRVRKNMHRPSIFLLSILLESLLITPFALTVPPANTLV